LEQLLSKVRSHLTAERLLKTVEKICGEFGGKSRTAGSPEELKAAEMVLELLREVGLDVWVEEFDVLSWRPRSWSLRVSEPERFDVRCYPNPYSPSVEDLSGDLTYVGTTFDVDLDGVSGGVALVDWCPWDVTEVKTQYLRVVEHGASAVVFVNHVEGSSIRVFPVNGSYGWSFSPGRMPRVPMLSISREDGERLKRLLRRGRVSVRLSVSTEAVKAKSMNVVGELRGAEDEVVVVSAHHDCWFSGACDNTSGVAIIVELARLFSKFKPRRTIRFVSFGAEESGALGYASWFWINGSREYVRKHGLDDAVANINFDGAGWGKWLYAEASPDLMKVVEESLEPVEPSPKYRFILEYPFVDVDHYAFFMEGLPVIGFVGWPRWDPNPRYHTDADVPENMDAEHMAAVASLGAVCLFRLSMSEELPLRPEDSVELILDGDEERGLRGVRELSEKAEALGLDMDGLVRGFERLRNSVKGLRGRRRVEACRRLNRGFLRVTAYGRPEETSVMLRLEVCPTLQAVEDCLTVSKALEKLRAGDVASALSELRRVHPYEELSVGEAKFYPPRYYPEHDVQLPNVYVGDILKALDSRDVDADEVIVELEYRLGKAVRQVDEEVSRLTVLQFLNT